MKAAVQAELLAKVDRVQVEGACGGLDEFADKLLGGAWGFVWPPAPVVVSVVVVVSEVELIEVSLSLD